MSGPAIAPHAAQNAQAAGLIATKFIKPGHAAGQAAFDAVLQKLLTSESQPQTGEDVTGGGQDAAESDAATSNATKSDMAKDDAAQNKSTAGDSTGAPEADPAAAIAALIAPQSGADPAAAAISALLASSAQAPNPATARQANQSTAPGVNVQTFAAKASTSAAQAWAARLQAQSQIGDSAEAGVAMLSDSTAQIAVGAAPTVAPSVVEVHVESARTFLGLDNSAQAAKLNAGTLASLPAAPANGATSANDRDVKKNTPSAPSGAARVAAPNGANAQPAAIKDATAVPFSAAPLDAAPPADAPNPGGAIRTQANAEVSMSGASARATAGGVAGASHGSKPSSPSRASGSPAKTGAPTASKAATSAPTAAPAGSGQHNGGGSTSGDSSNAPFDRGGGAGPSVAGLVASGGPEPVAASSATGLAATTALAIGPVTIDQLPDLIADQAATLANSGPSLASNGLAAANLNPVKELKVQLNPADLGSLTVKMRLANGSLAVVIEAAKQSTAKMIEGERDEIAGRLTSGDQPLASVTVRADGVPYQGDNGNGSSATSQQGGTDSGTATGSRDSSGSGRQAQFSRDDNGRNRAGGGDAADDRPPGRSVTGDLFV